MFAGIQRNGQAMEVLTEKQDVVSNNLSNAATPGFKKDSVALHAFGDTLRSALYTDRADGGIKQTGNAFDFALEGSGYFSIQTPQGVQYTRDGSFRMSASGEVVTAEGYPVLLDGGPLRVDPSDTGALSITSDRQVSVGNARKGRLLIVDFPPTAQLEKIGRNRLSLQLGASQESKAVVVQGALENSTVQSVEMMVDMMTTLRHFEANQHAIRMQDDALGRAIATLGQ